MEAANCRGLSFMTACDLGGNASLAFTAVIIGWAAIHALGAVGIALSDKDRDYWFWSVSPGWVIGGPMLMVLIVMGLSTVDHLMGWGI